MNKAIQRKINKLPFKFIKRCCAGVLALAIIFGAAINYSGGFEFRVAADAEEQIAASYL